MKQMIWRYDSLAFTLPNLMEGYENMASANGVGDVGTFNMILSLKYIR